MSTVNLVAREIAAKIVFYGPGLSGKTTTLQKIHDSVKPQARGELMSLPTEADRTLFFDFLPVKVERVGDCAVRLALYTVPGQVFYNATRKLVLQGADGVVFVVDSQPEALHSNAESFKNLEENLREQGLQLDRFPLVIQYNKRDLPKALPVDVLRSHFNPRGVPDFETCATTGQGVIDGLKAITRLVIKDLRAKRVVPSLRPEPVRPAPMAELVDSGTEMSDQIQSQLDREPVATPGLCAVLAPPELRELAQAVDHAHLEGKAAACVHASQELVRRVLSSKGTPEGTGYLLGIDGRDLHRLSELKSSSQTQAVDAAFAIYVAMQTLVRRRG